MQKNIRFSLFLSKNPLTIKWMQNEEDENLKTMALKTFKGADFVLKNTSIFAVVHKSKHYYQYKYTLEQNNKHYSWYFGGIKMKTPFELMIDFSEALNVTKLWLNIPVKNKERKVIGMIGTGMDISVLIKDLILNTSRHSKVMLFNEKGLLKAHEKRAFLDKKQIQSLISGENSFIKNNQISKFEKAKTELIHIIKKSMLLL